MYAMANHDVAWVRVVYRWSFMNTTKNNSAIIIQGRLAYGLTEKTEEKNVQMGLKFY